MHWWDGASAELSADRIGEYTDQAVWSRFQGLGADARTALQALPTLFAYETRVDTPAHLGQLTGIHVIGGTARLEYAVLKEAPLITPAQLDDLKGDLHIVKWEMNRTHWAIKDVDLGSVLFEHGILRDPTLLASSSSRHGAPRYGSAFISYGAPDEWFAERLEAALSSHGVRTFLFTLHAKPGEHLHDVMRSGVNERDKVILICSQRSLDRPGVQNEIQEALKREARLGGKTVLIPVAIDDYVFEGWEPDPPGLALAIRDRVVADFRDVDSSRFQLAVQKLLTALE